MSPALAGGFLTTEPPGKVPPLWSWVALATGETWAVAEKAAVGVKAKVASWTRLKATPPRTEAGLAWPCAAPCRW